MRTFDYVIVGAGSAGCVLANRLTEDPATTVLLLEAGPPDWHPFIHIPAGFIKTFYDPAVNWLYSMEPGEWTGGRRIAAPRGKTLGGSSSINGHIFNRGQPNDFNTWAQLGNRGWSYADVLPYFKRIERRIGEADPDYRGSDGNQIVTDIDWRHPLCDAFIAGAATLGIPRNPDYNGASQAGISYAQRMIYKGRRFGAARAFLNPAKRRPNLTIETYAHATRILLEGKRAVGVAYVRGDRGNAVAEARAGREVILSGGSYNSPQLLMLSGIGPADQLKANGIEVAHALSGVGENLKDHYAPRVTARVKNAPTINQQVRGLALAGQVARWMLMRKGILSLSPTLVYCFWRSDPAIADPDLQLTFTPASYKEGEQGKLEDEPGMTVAPWQQRPASSGHVRLASADPFAAPLIYPNYLAEESDRRILLAAMRLARRLLRTEPLQPYFAHEAFPGDAAHSDDELLAAAKQRGQTTFHPAGTCKMGPATDTRAVVGPDLKVHGLEGLRVVDASVMPTMLSANINAATLMIADKASDILRDRAPLQPATPARA